MQDWIRSIGKNLLLLLGIGYLFYGVLWAGLLGIWLMPYLMRQDYLQEERRKKEQMGLAFREALQSMSAALHAGYAAENAIREAIRDLRTIYGEQALIVIEFRRMWNEVQMQIPVEQIWMNFGERSGIPVIREFAIIFQTAKRSGGDLITIMDNTAAVIGEKLQVRQEIETILANKRLEWKIMRVIPLGIILYMKVSFPEFMDVLYGNTAGILLMSTALGIFLLAGQMGERILNMGNW